MKLLPANQDAVETSFLGSAGYRDISSNFYSSVGLPEFKQDPITVY